jgi:hypothetical protein
MSLADILEQAKHLSHQERKTLIIQLIEGLDELHSEQHIEEGKHYTAQELLLMPTEQRSRILAAAFEAAADDTFAIFEAYSEEDFGDDD